MEPALGGPLGGFLPGSPAVGSDPLADLAAALGSEPDDAAPLPQDNREEDTDAEPQAAAEPEQLGADDLLPLPSAYAAACAAERVQPCQQFLAALANVPTSLVVALKAAAAPSGVAGGAALTVPALGAQPGPAAVDAALRTLSSPSPAGQIVLLDHLDLSKLGPLDPSSLEGFVRRAAGLGPWWRLRSLDLRGCGLTPDHLRPLLTLDALPFVWHLQRLDLSGNPGIGAVAGSGEPLPPAHWARPDLLHMLHLWKHAPLSLIDLTDTGQNCVMLD